MKYGEARGGGGWVTDRALDVPERITLCGVCHSRRFPLPALSPGSTTISPLQTAIVLRVVGSSLHRRALGRYVRASSAPIAAMSIPWLGLFVEQSGRPSRK